MRINCSMVNKKNNTKNKIILRKNKLMVFYKHDKRNLYRTGRTTWVQVDNSSIKNGNETKKK